MEIEVTSTWIEATTVLSTALAAPTSSFEIANAIPGKNIIDLIIKFDLGEILISWYIDKIRNYFVTIVAPSFWKHFTNFKQVIHANKNVQEENSAEGAAAQKWVNEKLNKAVAEIYDSVVMFEAIRLHLLSEFQKSHLKLQQYGNNKTDNFAKNFLLPSELLRVALFTKETNRSMFDQILFLFFLRHFVNFNNKQKLQLGPDSDDEDDNNDHCDGNQDSLEEILGYQFSELCAKLHHLDLLVISEEIFTEILFDQISRYITAHCKGIYNKSLMLKIQHWANVVLFGWLKLVICLDNPIAHQDKDKNEKNFQMFQQWKTRLEFNIYETFANLRIREIFSLIVDFPESMPCLQDLHLCLTKTSQHKHLVAALKKSNVLRLLHPGANTSDIISQYISTIKAMKLIDPSGVILDEVGDPIRNYLRQREDTIRCIVTSFTTDDEVQHTELFEEFRRGKNRLDKNDDDDDDDSAGEGGETDDEGTEKQEPKQWQPDPLEASPSKSRHRKQDTIGLLVNIYGSSELFVNEYRNMLADRLIAILDYDIDKEVRNLELLKLRFEESSLHNCEIMLKDMADSKRTNALIKKACADAGDELSLDVTIVSHLFWPTIKEETLTLPEPIQQQFDKYSKHYSHVKQTRQLNQKPHLGSVELVLQFGETSLPFTVSPAHAAIIYLFQDDQTTLNLDTIAMKVGMAKEAVRKKLVYWVNMQILQEVSKDVFELVERDSSNTTGRVHAPAMMAEEEETQKAPPNVTQLEETMSVCENFILNMLANRGKCTLETIHTTLGFVLPNYSASPLDLKAFMQKLIREDKLELDGSEYAKK
eukprot:Phypoly_transcript_02817.p1 GENE.Phypoly_transcript_02817~~Phypoly_transcript_02817.p1  ORF type:complete len:818 (+),score=124.80 Phypoly_transcript_02817:172-2625(+)